MKLRNLLIASLLLTGGSASAQYYELANQLPQLISPALSGSLNYRGYAEVGYTFGVGSNKADFLNISTSQGFNYASWFFMGVGAGVDVLFSHSDDNWGNGWNSNPDNYHDSSTTAVCIPLFTDFRFNIGGNPQKTGVYFDIKIGASFLLGNNYVKIGNGYLTRNQSFYLRPSFGARIPIAKNGKQALNVGVVYQLMTQNYWSRYNSSTTLNGLGVTAGFEW